MSLEFGIGLGFGSITLNQSSRQKDPLCLAIERKACMAAMLDDETVKFAPLVVYTRGKKNRPTVDAVLLERGGKPVTRQTLRTYSVSDLSGMSILSESFTVADDFDPEDPDYAGRTICIVKTV
jgi:hypothetical protein